MRSTTAALLVVIGLGVLWLAVTGRLERIPAAWAALSGGAGTALGRELGRDFGGKPGAPPPVVKPSGVAWPLQFSLS